MSVLGDALTALSAGLVVGLPTDTVYGLAVDPADRLALERLVRAKGRPDDKPIPVLAADFAAACRVGMVPPGVASHWPGALTVVVPKTAATPAWVGDALRGTVAVRVPDHPVARELLARFGPLAVTSANRSGEPPAGDDAAARAVFGEAVAVYLPGNAAGGEASTVVDLTGDTPIVLRRGPVAWGP